MKCQQLTGIIKFELITYMQKCFEREHQVIVKTVLSFCSNPNGANYCQYCNHQLLKHKMWNSKQIHVRKKYPTIYLFINKFNPVLAEKLTEIKVNRFSFLDNSFKSKTSPIHLTTIPCQVASGKL